MAGVINYLYDLDQDVYVINNCGSSSITQPGTITRIRVEKTPSVETIFYDVRLTTNVLYVFTEEDVFPDKASALVELGNRID